MRFQLFFLAATGFAQPAAVFHADVSLVHVDAEVIAADGRILSGFSKQDFRVFDEGRPQPVVNFSAEEEPLDLILLFDISGSMRSIVEKVAAAARQGLGELHRGDRVSVMVFNTHSRVVAPFTEDVEAVERAVREDVLGLQFGGGTLIQQAVDDAARLFLHEPRTGRRRAVLIVTDNIGVRTRREAAVVRDFWEADALLSGLIIGGGAFQKVHTITRIVAPDTLLLEAGMKGIADKTGGDAIRSADPASAFPDMMRRIRSRYSLYYATPPGKAGATRAIRVELAEEALERFPKARVRARRGYQVPESKPSAP
jgi:VWFA-related protein